MFKIAIVEDQEETRESLNRFVRQYAQEQGLQVEISLITDGAEIAEHYTPGFDIIFMDVEMPRLDGFGAAEAIRAVDADVVLVFVTNMAQYAIRGYEVDALDYVLKPVNYYQFCTKLSRAIQRKRAAILERLCPSSTPTTMRTARSMPAASSCWIPLISIIWRPTAGCCTTTPPKASSRHVPACKVPKSSLPSIILSAATNAIWSIWPTSRALKTTLPL